MAGRIYLRLRTAAEMYDYDVRLLRTRCIRGLIPGATKEGKEWRVPVAGMDEMMVRSRPKRRYRVPG